ncbi:MAG: competence/damage-inducible protein A [Bacteroidia bacterium]|nr:MAG: competence/damage-inducible protein A [Bacteroidia bacterium]
MKADIITIGDEILIGQILDTNSAKIAQMLTNIGFEIHQIKSVHDDKDQIISTLEESLKEASLVIFTGGLGPTDDDITKETLAEYFEMELTLNPDVLQDIVKFVGSKNKPLNEKNKSQAFVPSGCQILRNKFGTAPGMCFKKQENFIISLPAVPYEMENLMQTEVLPLLKKTFSLPRIRHENVMIYGISESDLAEKLIAFEQELPSEIHLAYLPSPERIRLRLSLVEERSGQEEDRLQEQVRKLRDILGDLIFAEEDVFLEEVIANQLIANNKTLSMAESCTGGMLAHLLTGIPGSSRFFKGGTVVYSNEAKIKYLTVPENVLATHGAVSKEVVECMAEKQSQFLDTDYALAISGIAGPTGGSKEKPVGTVWIALAYRGSAVLSRKFLFGNNRAINIRRTSAAALNLLRLAIEGN